MDVADSLWLRDFSPFKPIHPSNEMELANIKLLLF